MRLVIEGPRSWAIKKCLERLASALQRARGLVKKRDVARALSERPGPPGQGPGHLDGGEGLEKAERAGKAKRTKRSRAKKGKHRGPTAKKKRARTRKRRAGRGKRTKRRSARALRG